MARRFAPPLGGPRHIQRGEQSTTTYVYVAVYVWSVWGERKLRLPMSGERLLGPRRMALPTHGFPISRIDTNVVEEEVEPQTARADHAFGAVEN